MNESVIGRVEGTVGEGEGGLTPAWKDSGPERGGCQGGGGGKGCHRVWSISPVTTSRGDSGRVRARAGVAGTCPRDHVIPALMAYSLQGNRDNRQGN